VSNSDTTCVHFSNRLMDTLEKVCGAIGENKKTLDIIQDFGIELSRTISALSTSAIKYARLVDNSLFTIEPVITNIPLVPKNVVRFINELRELAEKKVTTCENSGKIAIEVENGLVPGDLNSQNKHSGELKKPQLSSAISCPTEHITPCGFTSIYF